MFNVYVGEDYIISYDKSMETTFQVVCSSHNIPYLKKDEENYILFPSLRGINILVTNLSKEDQRINELAQNLIDKLLNHGAQVLSGVSNKSFSTFANIMNAQMLLGFYSKEGNSDKEYVRIFYSLKNKTKSLKLVSAITNNLMKQQQPISYKIANILEILVNPKYLKVYFCEVPTVLLEINTAMLGKIDIESAVIDGIIDVFQNKPKENEFLNLCDIIKDLETEMTCTYEEDKESVEYGNANNEGGAEVSTEDCELAEVDKSTELFFNCMEEEYSGLEVMEDVSSEPEQIKNERKAKKKKNVKNKRRETQLPRRQKNGRNYLSWLPPFEENVYQFRACPHEEMNNVTPMPAKRVPINVTTSFQTYQNEKCRERKYSVYSEPINLLDELKELGTLVERNENKNNRYI